MWDASGEPASASAVATTAGRLLTAALSGALEVAEPHGIELLEALVSLIEADRCGAGGRPGGGRNMLRPGCWYIFFLSQFYAPSLRRPLAPLVFALAGSCGARRSCAPPCRCRRTTPPSPARRCR